MIDITTESVTDLAHRLLSTDDAPKTSETHRLAAFIVDHHAHALFDKANAATPDKPTPLPMIEHPTELQKRLEPSRPGEPVE